MCIDPRNEAPKVATLDGIELNLQALRQQRDALMVAIERALGHLDVGGTTMAKAALRCAIDKVQGGS